MKWWPVYCHNNLRSFKLILKWIACISPERWKLWRHLEGIPLFTKTNKPLFLTKMSNLKGFLILSRRNWLLGKEESSFVSAIMNTSRLFSVKQRMLKILSLIELMLKHPSKTHFRWLLFCLMSLGIIPPITHGKHTL